MMGWFPKIGGPQYRPPEYYSPYSGDPQNCTPNFGKAPWIYFPGDPLCEAAQLSRSKIRRKGVGEHHSGGMHVIVGKQYRLSGFCRFMPEGKLCSNWKNL